MAFRKSRSTAPAQVRAQVYPTVADLTSFQISAALYVEFIDRLGVMVDHLAFPNHANHRSLSRPPRGVSRIEVGV